MIFFGLAVTAPFLCHFICRLAASRALLSVVASVFLMTLCIFVGEAQAPLPDYDLVFAASLIVWNVLAVIYAFIVSLTLNAIVGLFRRLRNSGGKAKHGG